MKAGFFELFSLSYVPRRTGWLEHKGAEDSGKVEGTIHHRSGLISLFGSSMNAPSSPYSRWETSRTILRHYASTDESKFLNLWGDRLVQRFSFIEDLSPTRTGQFLQKTVESMAKGIIFFLVVEDKEGHEFLGHISLNFKPPPPERDAAVGIALKERYRGRGFGTELMHWLITYGFREFGLSRISLTVLEDNILALRMYKKM
jgi:RimJ/RimL family protein N-acetyltransferase